MPTNQNSFKVANTRLELLCLLLLKIFQSIFGQEFIEVFLLNDFVGFLSDLGKLLDTAVGKPLGKHFADIFVRREFSCTDAHGKEIVSNELSDSVDVTRT